MTRFLAVMGLITVAMLADADERHTIHPTLRCEPDYIIATQANGDTVKSRTGGRWFVCESNATADLNPVWIHHTTPEYEAFGAGQFKDMATDHWTELQLIVSDDTNVITLSVHVRYRHGKVEFDAKDNEEQKVEK